ncbi:MULTISPECIES: vanadium-dependent haloperoxidase [unclassified Micromonospora]|uniref:vanadium-dependent haloperoxidase n=1 Tax=unclassified Micromonospora TaxID=2617518 RepID=UPI001C5FA8FB|nr:vanadium-dependent haloperoxidase [Micromonospora sp. RL09-050-HVF-A]MBW4705923.1 hypothetical protein [Micromonospora sp. RL09-050-HVF-A]
MDPIMYWNEVALEADRVTHTTGDPTEAGARGPLGSSRALAITHLAMHDAFFGIVGGQEPYLGNRLPTPPTGGDVAAAVAGAARTTLSALYPAQRDHFAARHLAAGLVDGKHAAESHDYGRRVAGKLLALRRGDPGHGDEGYVPSLAPEHHREDPDNPGQGFYAPFHGARSACFAVSVRHRLDGPPRPGDRAYRRALRQIRGKGIAAHLTGTLPDRFPQRTPTETGIGLFWAYDGAKGLGTPPRLFNQIVRRVARARDNDPAANARLFALVNTAMADGGILCWTEKYRHDLWRPVVGIREHDSALGPTGQGGTELDPDTDIGWLPSGAPNTNNVGQKNRTPNFPAYPSGHATFGAAALQTVRQFYGRGGHGPDDLADGLEFVSDELNGISVDNTGTVRPRLARRFPGGLWQMIEENGRSRVYLGVHWVFDAFAVDDEDRIDLGPNVGGVRLGLAVADDLATHGLHAATAAGPAEEPAGS